MAAMGILQRIQLQSPISLLQIQTFASSSNNSNSRNSIPCLTRRKSLVLTSTLLLTSYFHLHQNSKFSSFSSALAQEVDELQQEEDRLVQIFQETSSSVVFIKHLALSKIPKSTSDGVLAEDENAKVEGTGSGFIWDKFGHIVTNYHVVAKLATDKSGLQLCKVSLVDARGNSITKEGKIIGFDPDYDLAVLKVDAVGNELKPVALGTSRELRVGQSCFAIGNPYGFENTLTTGVNM